MCRTAALILPGMFSPRSALTRLLALLTPVCMIWVFAACVSLCSEHGAVDAGSDGALSVSAADSAGAQDCCPAGEASCGVLTDRATFVPYASATPSAPEAAAVPGADVALARPARSLPPDRPPAPRSSGCAPSAFSPSASPP